MSLGGRKNSIPKRRDSLARHPVFANSRTPTNERELPWGIFKGVVSPVSRDLWPEEGTSVARRTPRGGESSALGPQQCRFPRVAKTAAGPSARLVDRDSVNLVNPFMRVTN